MTKHPVSPVSETSDIGEWIGQVVRLHVNLTTGKFVLSNPKGRKKIGDCSDVVLRDVEFRVSEKQRQWVIAHKMRQVHAFAFGTLVEFDSAPITDGLTGVTYNPFRAPTFTTFDGEPVESAKTVTFVDRKGWMES